MMQPILLPILLQNSSLFMINTLINCMLFIFIIKFDDKYKKYKGDIIFLPIGLIILIWCPTLSLVIIL